MRTAIYIENGLTQIVLTPDNELEKKVVEQTAKHPGRVTFHNGVFYECQGGWVRHGLYGGEVEEKSLIMVLRDGEGE